MSSWLSTLKAQLESVDLNSFSSSKPVTEVMAKDNVVGEASDDLKRLYALAMQWNRAAMESVIDARFANEKEHQERHINEARKFEERHAALMNIFWVSIKDAFDLWEKPSVGIRKGWVVVWSEPEGPEGSGILNIFKEFLS